jgi:hypothetical protein
VVNFGKQLVNIASSAKTTQIHIDPGFEFGGDIPSPDQTFLSDFNVNYGNGFNVVGPATCTLGTTFTPSALGSAQFPRRRSSAR